VLQHRRHVEVAVNKIGIRHRSVKTESYRNLKRYNWSRVQKTIFFVHTKAR